MKKYKYTKSFRYDGKKYNVYGDTLEEAIAKKALKIKALEEGKVTISAQTTVKEWVDRCLLVYKPNVSPEYMKQSRGRIEKHIVGTIGNLRLKDVKPIQCQEILNAQIGRSKSHVTKLHQELCFIFDKAVENKLILESPAAHLTRPDAPAGHRRSLTDKERKAFLAVCERDPRFILFEFMLYCGCRPSEARAIQGKDVFVENDCTFLHIRGTKTANADRVVPIPAPLYDRVVHSPPFEFICQNRANLPYTTTAYNRLTNRLKREMNLEMGCRTYRNELIPPFPLADDFTPYIFRHTYCTDLQKQGIDVRVAQKLMGHADIQTTANIYTHQDEETMRDAAKILGAAYTPAYTRADKPRKSV